MNWFDSWALTLTVLIPAVGSSHLDAHSARRGRGDQVGRAARRRSPPSASTIGIVSRFDYDTRARLQFDVNKHWIDVINSRYHVGVDGISLPMLALSAFITVLCVIYSWNHFPEPHNPKAFLALHSDPRDRHERHVHRPGPDPVLRVLRDRAAPDVLHDRRVGRSQPRVRVDQVLPLHAVRLCVDAAELPGALLQGRRLAAHPRRTAQLRHGVVGRTRTAPDSCTARRC